MTRIEDRERVLFLYLPTGGGHLSNCKAISRRVAERYGVITSYSIHYTKLYEAQSQEGVTIAIQ